MGVGHHARCSVPLKPGWALTSARGCRPDLSGFEQRKDAMRPGERIRLYKLMRDLSLNDMVLAGGEGRELLAAIREDRALERLRTRQEIVITEPA
jgi:hypothetical protein